MFRPALRALIHGSRHLRRQDVFNEDLGIVAKIDCAEQTVTMDMEAILVESTSGIWTNWRWRMLCRSTKA